MEGERDGGSLWSQRECPLSYVIPRGARKQKSKETQERKRWNKERNKRRSWRGNCDVSPPAPGEKEAHRWEERRIGWEIHVGGLWMEIDSWISAKKR